MAALPTEATHFTDGHTLDARGVELFLDLVQLKGFDDRFDLLHDSFSSRVSLYCPTLPCRANTMPYPTSELTWTSTSRNQIRGMPETLRMAHILLITLEPEALPGGEAGMQACAVVEGHPHPARRRTPCNA
jgi:hypothetical protein